MFRMFLPREKILFTKNDQLSFSFIITYKMSLHKYFKPSCSKESVDAIPVAATIAELTAHETDEVSTQIQSLGKKQPVNKKKYVKYDEHKRCEVAQYAISAGNKSAARKFGIPLTTVRGFVKSYKELTVVKNPKEKITTLPEKKRGRTTLLPEEIDAKVIEMAKTMRISGAVVNYNVLMAIARGLIIANDRTLLVENGGSIQLGSKWCTSVFKRMKWSKRKCTTSKPVLSPGLIKEVGLTFHKQISEAVQADNVPPELIINIDQTPLPFVLISKYTMNQKGEKAVPILGTADYRQITGTFSVTMSGHFLPMQLIYQGKTDRCHPKYTFPSSFNVTHTPNHWSNEQTSIDLIKEILAPYLLKTREELGLIENHPWLLIADVSKGQWTDAVQEEVRKLGGKMIPVPNNWTPYFQPLDISVNKPCKDFLKNEAQLWYSAKISEQIKEGKRPHEIKVETQISIVKPLHAKWVTKFYDYIRAKPDIVRNGWIKSKIVENVDKKIQLDPFKL